MPADVNGLSICYQLTMFDNSSLIKADISEHSIQNVDAESHKLPPSYAS